MPLLYPGDDESLDIITLLFDWAEWDRNLLSRRHYETLAARRDAILQALKEYPLAITAKMTEAERERIEARDIELRQAME